MAFPTPAAELTFVVHYGYAALFGIIAAAEATSLIPIGILLIAVGALSRSPAIDFGTCLLVATLASVGGDMAIFFISRHLGKGESYRRFVTKNRVATRIEAYAARYPRGTVFMSRFIGLTSTPVNAIAGLSQMSPIIFFVFSLLGDALCCLAYLGAGYLIGAAWAKDADATAAGIGIAFLIGGAAYIASLYLRSRRKRTITHTERAP